jgi:hypothetical protein
VFGPDMEEVTEIGENWVMRSLHITCMQKIGNAYKIFVGKC